MIERSLETLLAYLQQQSELLQGSQRVLLLRAESRPELAIFKGKELLCHQTLKGDFERLVKHGYTAVEELPTDVDVCLFVGTKHKEENLWNFGLGIRSLKPGGLFLSVLPNELGAARFERELFSCSSEVISYTKNRCRVFGVRRGASLNEKVVSDWCARGEPRPVPGTTLLSRPGIFAWNKVDVGSEFLTGHIPSNLKGRGADLGSGYGYLSWWALSHAAGIEELHLVEAEKLALDVSRRNLEQFSTQTRLNFHWLDVTAGLPLRSLDWILMNPPFHAGKVVRMSLGGRFVVEASKALKPGGLLYMVANSHLPYEGTLRDHFAVVETLAQAKGFKIFRAQRA